MEDRPFTPSANKKGKTECDLTFKKENLCGTIRWQQAPSIKGESSLLLSFKTAEGDLVTFLPSDTIKATLWMPDHMHGSAPTKTVPQKSADQFVIKNIWFIMPGRWNIKFEIFAKDHLVDEDTLTLTL